MEIDLQSLEVVSCYRDPNCFIYLSGILLGFNLTLGPMYVVLAAQELDNYLDNVWHYLARISNYVSGGQCHLIHLTML